jgi:hypothetical protein
MEAPVEQVSELNIRVDALQQMVEQLGMQTAEILAVLKRLGGEGDFSTRAETVSTKLTYQSYQNRHALDHHMEHKDVLSDLIYTDHEAHGTDRNLTPEIQIQRLTAQLTAAYNRIAALEEQLIAKRIH